MAPRRETSAREVALEGAKLWADVEEDVEKKRHVKDPFREAYVALVAAPFDAFLAINSRRDARNGADDVDMERVDEKDDTEDHVALQHEISARSQQVHLRLEILRRQMQCLVDESSAVLDTSALAPKKEATRKKKGQVAQESTRDGQLGDCSIIDLERVLERASLYESGELTDFDLQKSWNHHRCECTTHEMVGAEGKLESMRARLNEEYEALREQQLLYFGPRLPVAACAIAEIRFDGDELTTFLEDCKRSIKPFFLEDFVQLDHEESQQCQDSQMDEIEQPEGLHAICNLVSAVPESSRDEDVVMGDDASLNENRQAAQSEPCDLQLPPPRCEGDAEDEPEGALQPNFCVASLQVNRASLHKKASRITAARHEFRSRQLPVCVSRQSVQSWTSAKPPTTKTDLPPLLCEPKKWQDVSMSIIDPTINLVELRMSLSEELGEQPSDEPAMPNVPHARPPIELMASSPLAASSIVPNGLSSEERTHALTTSIVTKRQLEVAGTPQNKKPRGNDATKRQRPMTLRMMMVLFRDVFRRVAQSSCVSYLSTLLRSDLASTKPQRAFVALVFSASLVNSNQAAEGSSSDKPLRVTLRSANAGHEVKIVCSQEYPRR